MVKIRIKLPQNVKLILDTLESNGYEAYIVGGCVRDSLLNKKPNDWDITTKAKPEKLIELFDNVILTGLKHGTVTVIINKEGYEVTTYRTDGEYEDNRHPKQVQFVNDLREDLARRDFTINAMAYNEKNGLIDYFEGTKDLDNKIIRTVGNPKQRFSEDALRMLRAIRFSAQLNFKIEEDIICSIKDLKDNMKNISIERIREEFNKILISNPKKINCLKECGILKYILPYIKDTYDFNQNNPYHIYNLYDHILTSTEVIEPVLHLRLTMLLHDLGKIKTKTVDENGIYHYYGHSKESVEIAHKILKDLKYDNDTIDKVLILIQYHDCNIKSKLSIKKLLNKIGENLIRDLIKVQRADILAQNPIYSQERLYKLNSVEANLEDIIFQNECFSLKDLKIDGKDLIDLGFNRGKEIGETLKYLLELVMKEPKLNVKELLMQKAKEKLKY